MPYINAEVYVDPSEFTDDELLDELQSRGLDGGQPRAEELSQLILDIYNRATTGQDYQSKLAELFDLALGRIYVPG